MLSDARTSNPWCLATATSRTTVSEYVASHQRSDTSFTMIHRRSSVVGSLPSKHPGNVAVDRGVDRPGKTSTPIIARI